MKNMVKLFGIIALVAVIGFSMAACSDDDGGGGGKSVRVGSQSGTLTPGTAGSVTYTVTTNEIANGSYAATVANLPTGVTASSSITIASNTGTLTLTGSTTTTAGTTSNLKLTLDGTTSGNFSLVIGSSSGGGGPVPVNPGELAGRYFTTAANATGNLDTNRQFEITSEGRLVSYSGATSIARNFYITSVEDDLLCLTYVPTYGTGNHTATVDYDYDATAKTLTVYSPYTTSDLGISGIFMGNFSPNDDGEKVYYKN
ncbi:MAG: hypothetical protein LBH20_05590 [Treponema sp.]|nr:hypothetical protein [Treponema sp.]